MRSINRHFKAESWLMLALFLVPIALGLLAIVALPYIERQIDIDRCLDAGGAYNNESETCLGAKPH
ncbi:MAG: hypothetical protein I8H88_14585 [Burkholderiales bacterium]|nr:hypothetical protein [Burkholderiales bacterium]